MSFQCRSSCRRKNCLSTGRHVRHRRLFSQHLSRIQYCGKLLNLYAAQNFIFSIHSASVFIPFIQSITANQENTNIAEKETVSIIYTSCHESFILCWNIRAVTSIILSQYLWINSTATWAHYRPREGEGACLVLTIIPACYYSPGRAPSVYWNNNGTVRGRFWNSIIPVSRSFSVQTRGSALSLTPRVSQNPVLPREWHMAVKTVLYKKWTKGEQEENKRDRWLEYRSNRANARESALYNGQGISACPLASRKEASLASWHFRSERLV